MFNTEVLKCHEDLIALETLCTTRKNINIVGYLGAGGGGGVMVEVGGASIIRLGQSWYTSTLSLIIIYMSNIKTI